MADDIDIEEHSLGDNPDVSGIFPDFPDLNSVKTEVIDIEDGFEEHHANTSTIPSTSVIPDSTTDVDFNPPRTTDSPHIISSTSIPEDPEEITDKLNVEELVKTNETIVCNNISDESITISENNVAEDLDLSIIVENDIVPFNASVNEKPITGDLDDEFVDVINDNEIDKDVGNDEAFFGNCIILGSKSADVDREEFYEDDKCFNSFVALEDWGPYLNGSDCYCSECEILFATVNALDFHKMQAHSHLVAVLGGDDDTYASDDSPKDESVKIPCGLCSSFLSSKQGLQKHMRLMHNPNSIPVMNNIILGTKKANPEGKTVNKQPRTYAVKSSAAKTKPADENTKKGTNVCFVCQFQCSSDDDLINHLYKLHTFRCEVCNTVFAKKDQYDVHMLCHNPQLSIKQQKLDTPTVAPNKKLKLEKKGPQPATHLVRRCNDCPAQFSKLENLRKHCQVYKIKLIRPLKPTQRFDPVCPICGAEFLNGRKFNNHIRIHNCHNPQDNVKAKMLVAQCKFCPAQFVRSKYLMYHCEAIHKITLPKQPPRNKPFNPRCPFCPKTFTNIKRFNSHIDTNHSYVDFQGKQFKKDQVTKTFPAPLKLPLQTSTKVSYKCLKCEIQFSDLPAAKAHGKSAHSKHTGETLIKKVTQQVALIQTNFLFRCDKCDVHFASPSQAYAHSNANCEEKISSIPCKQCKLKINMNDVASHNKKHEINDELTVIDVSDSNLNDRILCKCPSCRLHFNEADYTSHYTECSSYGRIPYWCVFCDLYIDIKAQPAHDRFHYELKLKRDALIILLFNEIVKSSVGDNIDGTDNVVDKTEQDSNAVTSGMDPQSEEYTNKMEAIKMKTQGIYKLIECTLCDTFRSFHIDSALDHIEGQCKTSLRRSCYFCGIRILNKSSKTHEIDHSCYPKLNIKDTIFFDENLNVTKPRVPKLVKCTQCSVSFESEYDLSRHSCGNTEAERCGHCNEDVVTSYFNFHTQYHEYRLHSVSGLEYAAPRYEKNLARNEDLEYDEEASDSDEEVKNELQETPTKMQTSVFYNLYKPGDTIIVFQCKNCKLSSFSSSFRELHKECKTISFTCNICKLKFGYQYRPRHRKFHNQYPNVNINTYDIIEFAFGDNKTSGEPRVRKKLSLNKLPVSKKLPVGNKISVNNKPHMSNKLAVTDAMSDPIKSKLRRRGIAVFYQCRNCKLVSIGRNFVFTHPTCIDYTDVYTCDICEYSCAPHYRLSHIYWHRSNPKIKKDKIIISPFNPGMVRNSRNRKMLVRSKPTTHINTIKSRPKPDNSLRDVSISKKPKIFECVKCGFASTSVSFPHTHKDCETPKRCFYCEICEIKFFYKFKSVHKEFHAKTPNAGSEHFKIIRFDPDNVFRAISAPKHAEYLKSGKVVLFQCVQCKLVSPSRVIMQTHLPCDNPKQYHHCKMCGYKVFMSDKRKHILTHCSRPQLKRSEIIVSQFDPRIERQFNQVDDADEPPSANKKHIIFRCEICDVCTEEGMDHECKEGIKKVVCGICSLTFEGAYYGKHAAKHSDPNFNDSIEIINIEGETPTHYRKRKLQSVNETPIKIPRLSEVATTDDSFSASDSNTDGEDTIFKCPCDLHFLSRHSCASHIRACDGGDSPQPLNTCKYCNRNFAPFPPNRVLKEHISRHHDGKIKFKVISWTMKHSSKSKYSYSKGSNLKYPKIYKCRNCCLFFPTFADCKSNRHVAICGISSGLPCSICNLEIMECFIEEHAKIHSNGKYNSIDEFKVIVVSKDKVVTDITSTENVLYKCTKCEAHFLNTDAIECHYPCQGSARRQIKCPECALKFYSANLFAHISSQHTLHNFDINDLIIKNVDPKEQPAEESNPIPEEVASETDDEDSKQSVTDPNLRTKKIRNTLYQCIKCKVNFVHNKCSLKHRNCSIDKPASNFTCDKCKLVVYLPDKEQHLLIHHSEDNNLTCEDDYMIHRQNSYQNRSASSRVQYSTSRRSGAYPVFGSRAAKSVVKKPKNVVDEEEEPNVIYKCYECDICFIYKVSILKHSPKYALHDSAKNKMPCDECGLQFGPWILKQHKEKHHKELKLKLEDFKILTIDDVRKETDVSISESDVSMDSSTKFNNTSISKLKISPPHKSICNTQAAQKTKESTPGTSPKQDDKHKVKLYKCKDCNVNFLKQNLCYRHVIHHEPLSTYDFLECKVCTLNFPIQYLQQHMAQHKTHEFGLKDILIEEYEPLQHDSSVTKRGTPKIDIYNAIDRDPKSIKDKEITINSNEDHKTDNTDKENDIDSSKKYQNDENTKNTESKSKELPNTSLGMDTTIVKTENTSEDETANPDETLESDNILNEATTASSSDKLKIDENGTETEPSDSDNRSLELTSKDDNSLQPMDIDTDYSDRKIINGANADEK